MTDITNPFSPSGNTVNIAMTTSSGNVLLTSPGSTGGNVVVYNDAATVAFVNFGSDNTAAASTTTSMPVAPGGTRVFQHPGAGYYGAAILASGSGNIYFTTGHGV